MSLSKFPSTSAGRALSPEEMKATRGGVFYLLAALTGCTIENELHRTENEDTGKQCDTADTADTADTCDTGNTTSVVAGPNGSCIPGTMPF